MSETIFGPAARPVSRRVPPPVTAVDSNTAAFSTAIRSFHTDMSSRQKKPDARALFKQAKSRKGENGASLGSSGAPVSVAGRGASSSPSAVGGGKYVGKSKEEVSDK